MNSVFKKIGCLLLSGVLLIATASTTMAVKQKVSAAKWDANAIKLEADYILQCQQNGGDADGAINDVYGKPTWVVPRENAMAILNLLQCAAKTGDSRYSAAAKRAMNYLVRVQDSSDGAWYDQYDYTKPVGKGKSPTQTAEVMIALQKSGYSSEHYAAMKKGAEYLMSCQRVENKTGVDDGLICGGKESTGGYSTWRWCSDCSYSWLALKAAADWAHARGDSEFENTASTAAQKLLSGIDNYLYITDKSRADYGVWWKAVDANGTPMERDKHEWINYAPQMLDVPAQGTGNPIVGEWIHKTLQNADGAVVWDDNSNKNKKSPGYSFQATLVWEKLGQKQYSQAALNWALGSGLWQLTADSNKVKGGWIDWKENSNPAPTWQRFIDTSFYAVSAFEGGYNFVGTNHAKTRTGRLSIGSAHNGGAGMVLK